MLLVMLSGCVTRIYETIIVLPEESNTSNISDSKTTKYKIHQKHTTSHKFIGGKG